MVYGSKNDEFQKFGWATSELQMFEGLHDAHRCLLLRRGDVRLPEFIFIPVVILLLGHLKDDGVAVFNFSYCSWIFDLEHWSSSMASEVGCSPGSRIAFVADVILLDSSLA